MIIEFFGILKEGVKIKKYFASTRGLFGTAPDEVTSNEYAEKVVEESMVSGISPLSIR